MSNPKSNICYIERSNRCKHLLMLDECKLLLSLLSPDEIFTNSPTRKATPGKGKHLGVKLDVETYLEMRECAWRNRISLSELVRRFLREGLDREHSETASTL